jgi:hypothetical protein
LDKDRSVFYDDVHFNEDGARQVAATLAGFMATEETRHETLRRPGP